MNESVQKWLERNRPPRVKITYDVETLGSIEKKELPFVVGLFADLSGDRAGDDDDRHVAGDALCALPDYALRKMQAIDRDSFDNVMGMTRPRVLMGNVPRTLPASAGASAMLGGVLEFHSLDDFNPVNIVQNVPALNSYYRLRGNIRMLQTKAECSTSLANALVPLMDLGTTGNAARKPLQLLADPASRAGLSASRSKLRTFAGGFAAAATAAAKVSAAQTFGFTGATADADARKFLGLFGAANTVENSRKAQDQLTALASYSNAVADVDLPTQAARSTISQALGVAVTDTAGQTKLATEAAGILAVLATPAPLPATPTAEQLAAQALRPVALADAQLAALVYLGLQESENCDDVVSTDAAPLSGPQLAEQKHTADCRWFADNMLMVLQPPPAPSDNDTAALSTATASLSTVAGSLSTVHGTLDSASTSLSTAGNKPPEALASLSTATASLSTLDGSLSSSSTSLSTTAASMSTATANAAAMVAQAKAGFANLPAVMALLDAAGLKTDDDRVRFMAPLGYFVTDILASLDQPGVPGRKPVSAAVAIDQRVAQIDDELSVQLRAIMHAPNFQALEATWRGLAYLVSRAETGKMLKLYVYNATQLELLDDMDKAVDKDQSHIFKMIYEDGYGTLGGEPYSLLVGGYEVGRSAQDIDFLSKMAEIAAASHAPFIAAASPSIFGLETFNDLTRPRDLEKIFEGVELVGFQEFRDSEDSRYVTLVLPHVLLRLPYGAKSMPVEGMAFEENADASNHGDFLWGNASYMLAERITNAFSLYAWTAAIRGVEGGGLIEGLPLYTYPIYPNNSGAEQLFCPTEVSITDRREKELNDLGFIALCHCKGTGTAAFFGGQTTNAPKQYISDDANSNAKLSALMPYMLAASRFAHYIKVIMRDKIGSFMTGGEVEAFLNTWISQYVLLDENATQDAKASFPLSQANVVVTDVPGSPGAYNAVVFLRPHFQLEELTTSIRLVANIPAAA